MNNNNITLLSKINCSKYAIAENGIVYNIKNKSEPKEIKTDCKNRLYIIDDNNNHIRIPLKKLYRLIYNKEYAKDDIQNLHNETWKEIADTGGKYFISNYGRVKSYCGYNAVILKPYKKANGYLTVKISGKHFMIHRLVAFAFC